MDTRITRYKGKFTIILFQLSHFSLLFIALTAIEQEPLSSSSSIISRFQEYLQINTAQPNPNYFEAANFILSQAKSLSLESQIIEFVKNKPLILLKWPGENPIFPSVLLNSHVDVVPVETQKWVYSPFGAHIDFNGNIHARGSQDTKCVGLQYLEAIRKLKDSGFEPVRTVYLSFVPDEEIGGRDGAEMLVNSDLFEKMNVAFVLDEGLPSPGAKYRAFYAERSPWWLVIKAKGAPGHGAKLYDNSAMENLLKSIESIRRFRASQFDLLKAGLKAEGEVVSVNMVFLKAGTETPTGFVMNLQPSEAEVGLDIRVPPTADPNALGKRIAEEWAPASRNMTFEFKLKFPVLDKFGKPVLTAADSSNPWWVLLEEAVYSADRKLEKPEINTGSTDARYFRRWGLPAIGFSPMANTPILIHDHNEAKVTDTHGDQHINSDNIGAAFVEFYSGLLGTDCRVSAPLPSSFRGDVLIPDQQEQLTANVSDEEIKHALFSIGDNKSPGPDGLSSAFFKKTWDIIQRDFCDAIRDFFSTGKLLKQVNSTFIALIPKGKNARLVSDYRPISLCNVIYKTITKILANRTQSCLPSIVGKEQGAFVPDRKIFDNILMGYELFRKYSKEGHITKSMYQS